MESLFETAHYNQALIGIGVIGVIATVGTFVYFLLKRKHL
jgi:hypothetical protein